MKGTVVVGFVDTAVGRAAVDAAVRECQLRSARLVVVSSVTGGPGNELYAQRDAVARLTDEVAQAGTEMDVREYARGNELLVNTIPKVQFTLICADEHVDGIVDIICNAARTGAVGDGKIWVEPVEEVIRIRTGEHGPAAV